MLKKIFNLAIVFALLLSVQSCGKEEPEKDPAEDKIEQQRNDIDRVIEKLDEEDKQVE